MRRIILQAFLPIEHLVFHLPNCDMTFDVETRCVKENDDDADADADDDDNDNDNDDIFPSPCPPPLWGGCPLEALFEVATASFLVLFGAPSS